MKSETGRLVASIMIGLIGVAACRTILVPVFCVLCIYELYDN